ncbi:MAG: hypothetical protein RI895_1336 [Actinomycetota bacterium]
MKNLNMRTITALSAFAIFAGAMQPANAASRSSSDSVKPVAPTIVSVTQNAPSAKGTSAKTFANIVVTIGTPLPGTRTLVTIKGGRSCKIEAPAISCTISKIKVGKTLQITAKSKFAGSGYGPKSAKYPFTVSPTP